ncbi:MAG: DUF3592 domain-containing protein [Chitinophagaceae bacterium]
MNSSRIQAIVSVALGVVLIAVGLLQRMKRKKLLEHGIEVEGEIFDVLGNSKKNDAGYPVIRFITKDNTEVSEKYKVNIPFSKKGQKVLLLYNAGNPKEFVIKKIL